MYVKDRMEEVSSPDKEMVRIVLFLSFSKRGETRMLMLLSGLSVYLYIHVDMHTHTHKRYNSVQWVCFQVLPAAMLIYLQMKLLWGLC